MLLGEEPLLPYDRPPLSKQVLVGAWDYERIQLRDEKHYQGLDVRIRQARACGLDVAGHRLRLADGTSLGFDRLIIATGVRPRNLLHGDAEPFSPVPYFWTDQYDVKIQAHGVIGEGGEVTVEEGSFCDGRFVALYRTGGQLTGVLGWNAPARILPYLKLLLDSVLD